MAPVALKRLLVLVNQHVSFQLIRIREFGRTQFTAVRPFPGMDTQVTTQVCNLYKLPVTVGTTVRFFSRMQTHMSLKVVVPGESLVTSATFKWLFARVCPLVILKHMLVAETAVTNETLERPLTSGQPRTSCGRCRGPTARRVGGPGLCSFLIGTATAAVTASCHDHG